MQRLTNDHWPSSSRVFPAGHGPPIGVHASVAGGLDRALYAGAALGCDCLQVFVKNQRQWRAPPLTREQIVRYQDAQHVTGMSRVVAHAAYLLNLASPSQAIRRRSIAGMIDELERCEVLGIGSLVFHPGAFKESTLHSGVRRVARALNNVHQACPDYRTRILLETTAGQGTAVGWRFAQLGDICADVTEADRLGICLDTCHLFAAGYDFRTPAGYAAMIDELDAAIGVDKVECIHLNDSKRELGSRVDRHEHIGKGKIGKAGFGHFLNDPRFAYVPMILETPKGKDGRGTDLDKVNLKRLRALVVRQ